MYLCTHILRLIVVSTVHLHFRSSPFLLARVAWLAGNIFLYRLVNSWLVQLVTLSKMWLAVVASCNKRSSTVTYHSFHFIYRLPFIVHTSRPYQRWITKQELVSAFLVPVLSPSYFNTYFSFLGYGVCWSIESTCTYAKCKLSPLVLVRKCNEAKYTACYDSIIIILFCDTLSLHANFMLAGRVLNSISLIVIKLLSKLTVCNTQINTEKGQNAPVIR